MEAKADLENAKCAVRHQQELNSAASQKLADIQTDYQLMYNEMTDAQH